MQKIEWSPMVSVDEALKAVLAVADEKIINKITKHRPALNTTVADCRKSLDKLLNMVNSPEKREIDTNIQLVNHPEKKHGSGLYRAVIVLEVLSDSSIGDADIASIVEDFQSGDSSGRFNVIDEREISKKDMAILLTEQGSDPAFLIPDDEDE